MILQTIHGINDKILVFISRGSDSSNVAEKQKKFKGQRD